MENKSEPEIGMPVTVHGIGYTVASVKLGLIAGPHVRLVGDGPDADGGLIAWRLCRVDSR